MSEVDNKGQVLTQFTDVMYPHHLSTTSEGDVLVAHWGSDHHVPLLNSQLRLERVLLDRNSQVKSMHPLRLHYDKLTSQLYVIHYSNLGSGTDVISQWSLR